MSAEPEKTKKAPRKHVTTACVPCRESKIRVCALSLSQKNPKWLQSSNVPATSVMEPLLTVRIVSEREKNANTNMETTSASKYLVQCAEVPKRRGRPHRHTPLHVLLLI